MNKNKKIISMLIISMLVLFGAAFAVNINSFNIEEVNDGYKVLATLENNQTTTEYTIVKVEIEELGIEKTMNNGNPYTIENNSDLQLTYSLSDIVDLDLLSKGNLYTVTIKTYDTNGNLLETKRDNFLFSGTVNEGLGLVIKGVKVNDVEVKDYNVINVKAGEDLKVEMIFEGTQNYESARLRAEIEGYEHAILGDSTDVFLIREGNVYKKTFTIHLPEDMNTEREYKLRIYGASDLSGLTYKEYNLYVDTERHKVDIIDFVTTPSTGIEAGQGFIANVRIKNRGQNPEESIKITVNIPDLGIEESTYVSDLNKNEAVTSDDLLLYVPTDVQPGTYDVIVTLSYNDGYTSTNNKYSITVLPTETVTEKPLIVSYNNELKLEAGKSYTFDVIIANPNRDSKALSLSPVEVTWADINVEPTLKMVSSGSDATFKVTITPKNNVSGEKSIALLLKEENKVIKNLEASVYVEKEEVKENNWNLTNVLLAVLLLIAIIVLLKLVVSIFNKNEKNEESSSSDDEEYY